MNDLALLLTAIVGLATIFTAFWFFIVPNSSRSGDQNNAVRRRREGNTTTEEDDEEIREARKKGKKALRKVMKRREKERRRREREAAQESKQDAKSAKDAKYRKKIEEREKARLEKEEALKQAMKEKEEQERKEYEAMKSMFEVEESAVDETSKIDTSNWLQEFVDYIKLRKVVVIEDIAAEFQLRSKEVVERIESLERMGRVTGVVDDRGKFIYITNQEMQKVADFIQERGRVSLADLAVQSNYLVDLEPKEQEFEEEVKQEEKKI
eukprot:g1858.t1